MRLGLYGGTFDPIHIGHLLVAETCREAAALDQVWFVPAARSPHKATQDTAPDDKRLAMLKLAISGHAGFEVCTVEFDRGGLSYTVDTLRAIDAERPNDELFFLMGGDSLVDFPTWKSPDQICELAMPLIIGRPGSPPPDLGQLKDFVTPKRLDQIKNEQVTMPMVEISSSDIRERVAADRSIRYQVPRAVEKFIEANGLYQTETRR